jgi:tryptophan-rich sensory protein
MEIQIISLDGGDFLKIQWKKLALCVAIPLAVGGLSAFFTQNNMQIFETIKKPFLSPPGWLFPVVWIVLYILMGIASYLVVVSGKTNDTALTAYSLQLVFNFFWSLIFFHQKRFLLAFLWLILLWLLIYKTLHLFYQISKTAGYLMLPYLAWVTFAGYLNYSIFLLNFRS